MVSDSTNQFMYFDCDYNFTNLSLTAYHLGLVNNDSYQNQAINNDGDIFCAVGDQVSTEFINELNLLRENPPKYIEKIEIQTGFFFIVYIYFLYNMRIHAFISLKYY